MKNWISVPLSVVTDPETGQLTVLPTRRDFINLRQTAETYRDELSSIPDDKRSKDRRSALESMIDATERMTERYRDLGDKLQSFAVVENFEFAVPTFGELLEAEEHAKDWVTGVARIDEGKLTLRLLAGNVRKDGGAPYSEEDVRNLHPLRASALWVEVKAHVQNSADRLPFLLSLLKTHSKETSPTTPG